MKKTTQIAFVFVVVLMLVSCKNTKQKIQEHVTTYNTSSSINGPNITSTSAKAFLKDNKIEIRIETNLEETDENKLAYSKSFPDLLKGMIENNQISKELIDEDVKFDVYLLAYNNSIIAKQLIGKEELVTFTGSAVKKVAAKL
ncbi:hypothetical protein [Flavobacterium chungangense]|uniref:DUF1307 domain-containing protein n=1 Tax=Flavobacterium chungangense TaxID=554283 RepID=A0A6V6YVR7_9FLAO|nr:hypothetical protein [Flavobacterium chungangense]CAD0003409.1 hypothetical protein FLACHUCJ7_01400 [Flavobacterium chungangense]